MARNISAVRSGIVRKRKREEEILKSISEHTSGVTGIGLFQGTGQIYHNDAECQVFHGRPVFGKR